MTYNVTPELQMSASGPVYSWPEMTCARIEGWEQEWVVSGWVGAGGDARVWVGGWGDGEVGG